MSFTSSSFPRAPNNPCQKSFKPFTSLAVSVFPSYSAYFNPPPLLLIHFSPPLCLVRQTVLAKSRLSHSVSLRSQHTYIPGFFCPPIFNPHFFLIHFSPRSLSLVRQKIRAQSRVSLGWPLIVPAQGGRNEDITD